ncbi:MAG: OadG family protein [Brooklawnia sp.]|uniref:OadG family protein n=1 Tax=Brooklawnia sp. TaxID=2699740 RepID=UPI003C779CD0
MADMGWGLQMMLLGMGTVFLMLIALMVVLILLGKTDKSPTAPAVEAAPEAELESGAVGETAAVEEDPNAWMTIADASGLTPEQIAAVSVAVAVHADVRRKQAAPVHRVHAPGSRLWASRWVAMGRSSQMHNTQRR